MRGHPNDISYWKKYQSSYPYCHKYENRFDTSFMIDMSVVSGDYIRVDSQDRIEEELTSEGMTCGKTDGIDAQSDVQVCRLACWWFSG